MITIYPRKGTETQAFFWHIALANNYNLSPQGDGNVNGVVRFFRAFKITIYPRKGTETSIQ